MSLVTVLTPTYNRVKYMNRLFQSLWNQSCFNFEWIVVDDGSTDDTKGIVNGFDKGRFPIRIISKSNGGKHTAINAGVQAADGKLLLILDSDDELPPNTIENIAEEYFKVKDNPLIGGLCGYMAHRDGTIIGHPVLDCIASSLELRYKFDVIGDMCEVFLTDVLREFPFPELGEERFCPEALVWNRISQKYKLQVFHKIIYYRDYLDGGLTDNIIRIRMNSPVASMMTYQELTTYEDVPNLEKIKAAINYWRFRFCKKNDNKSVNEMPKLSSWFNLLAPLGWLMHARDKVIIARRK